MSLRTIYIGNLLRIDHGTDLQDSNWSMLYPTTTNGGKNPHTQIHILNVRLFPINPYLDMWPIGRPVQPHISFNQATFYGFSRNKNINTLALYVIAKFTLQFLIAFQASACY